MKKLKRLVSTVFAVLMTATVSGMMPVSADEIVYGDINNDGVVNISDMIAFNKYLNGIYDLYDYEVADINCNCIIDAVDSEILYAYVTLLIDELPYTNNTI